METLKRLIALASKLDKKGLHQEADTIDYILLKLAMSLQDAQMILGVSPSATNEEIQKAWKQKVFQLHPDRGGSEEEVKKINVARDILMGRQKEYMPRPEREYRPPERAKPEPQHITFEEAKEKVNIPEGVEWKFVTDTSYSPYLGDLKTAVFVAYGVRSEGKNAYGQEVMEHIFVGVCHYKEMNHYTGTDIDTYKMYVETHASPYGMRLVIGDLFKKCPKIEKGFSGKVVILPEGTPFDKHIGHTRGRSVSLKNALEILSGKPVSTKGKVDIVLELKRGESFSDYILVFVVNGRPYELSQELSDELAKKSGLLRAVFGTYYYTDSKKNLTRMKKNKEKVLNYLIKKLGGKGPEDLVEALKRAAGVGK